MIGNKLRISIFGESHSDGIGIIMEGFPAGFRIDEDYIKQQLIRRAGGHDSLSTPRKETDGFKFLGGVFEGHSTGAPVCIFIPNENRRSNDYDKMKTVMRPSHSDYTAFIKYRGMNDYRGGGHFSGRLTAALVAAGAIARQYLISLGIKIAGHIYSIGDIFDLPFDLEPQIDKIDETFPVIDGQAGKCMKEYILEAKQDNDSVGGVVEVCAVGLPVGVGEPFWNSVESVLAHMLFSIPAVKGVEFGAGFGITAKRGSEANDSMYYENNSVKTRTNNNGGVCGGITNGMPVIVRTAFKPTPSIAREQETVDVNTGKTTSLEVKGRHDPCIVKRAVPVVEAVVALGLLDLMLLEGKTNEFGQC